MIEKEDHGKDEDLEIKNQNNHHNHDHTQKTLLLESTKGNG